MLTIAQLQLNLNILGTTKVLNALLSLLYGSSEMLGVELSRKLLSLQDLRRKDEMIALPQMEQLRQQITIKFKFLRLGSSKLMNVFLQSINLNQSLYLEKPMAGSLALRSRLNRSQLTKQQRQQVLISESRPQPI